MRALRWFIACLDRPRASRVIILSALLLALPSIFSPFFVDEYLQASKWRAWQQGTEQPTRHILNDYFVFIGPEGRERAMESLGVWWMAPDLKIAFWRPLAAATHVVDQYLWPDRLVPIHLHTLLWLAALLTALSHLLRRFLAPVTANLALALYAWDDARGMVLSWIANRHALLAACFGVCALIAHDRGRRDRWRWGAYLAPALLGLGLLSSEMALATVAFLFAHAVWVEEGPLRRRLARLWPYVAVVVAWQAVYVAGGFGVAASGAYQNPLTEPLAFAARVLERAPVYALAQLTPVESMFWGMLPTGGRIAIYLLALAVVGLVAWVAWPRLAGHPQARFWLGGAAFSLVFICASAPWDRHLLFVGLGAAPALAMLLAALAGSPAPRRGPRAVASALVLFNLVLAPLLLPLKSLTILGMSVAMPSPDADIPRDPAIVSHKTLVIPWLAFEAPLWFTWSMRDAQGVAKPAQTRILATSLGDVTVTRTDPFTLRVQPSDGFFPSDSSSMFRSSSRPFRPGDVVRLPNFTATVVEVMNDGRPRIVEFRLATALEDPEWLWMRGVRAGLVPWTPPQVGQTVVLSTSH